MAKVKIIAPNKSYTGVSASVAFSKGVGETEDEHLVEWFKEHGYDVVEEDTQVKIVEKSLDEMTVEELVAYAAEKGIDIGKSTSQSGIIEKINTAQQDPNAK
ncbi:hypothetical protein [Clostridium beijerinckii]|uniref:hypothetical protein n=1 Tax=Clostridium beijerinckii TaxID=1520 RepID=UPI00080A793D|nr:hypothetical protein [Clostridium beijerinckii]OCA99391.1 hypothetical protein BGS1_09100 [Clostridium beijerinckii]